MKTLPAPHDRPREKLERCGASALGENELVALVLGEGTAGQSALEVADRLLDEVGGLRGLARVSGDGLTRVGGVGPVKAARLVAAVELGRRSVGSAAALGTQLATPREIARLLTPLYGARAVEQAGVVLLDARHRLLKTTVLSTGTLDGSIVHPRDVFRVALGAGASAVVLFHNHPSGDPSPSPDDVALTRRMALAGDIMGIEMLDHVIITDGRYFSFKEHGSLPSRPPSGPA